ncbi:DUF1428 domain-containing protein [Sphingomonas morindae]|uniref:DUF1428 domain-containing protein n=1 Tax=Sphingomonas morindae TaxID=1541170 RepID=A0ABY4XCK9_9SPHN|nr:DUF1428 domain-containing protein [Sphingomonas morindae]USI74709.1 DUF1428 domain-containing protein [Sphingomonas morindae]
MYICGLVIPVPDDSKEAYRRWAENSADFFKDYGCLEIVECWEDFIPNGVQTDFRKAVAARDGEKIVFTWQVWSDKASFQAAEEKMHHDPRMDSAGTPPFDAKRLILGCFQPIARMTRDGALPALC